MPIILASVLAAGVILGLVISKKNNFVTAIDGSDKMSFIDDVFTLINDEYVDTINIKDLQIDAVKNVLEKMDIENKLNTYGVFWHNLLNLHFIAVRQFHLQE